ncbi:phage tail tape measure protein [Microvirga antarctica]|uniref:phage tail tape measure protein n=1 Tax=Microvirga antarctica TaxID=2819233 RepID=UPI001B30580D|nr:phage tail tape measure protein [Microvirga antarctica]
MNDPNAATPGPAPDDGTARDRQRQLDTLIGLSDRFGTTMTKAFAKNVAEGNKFDAMLKSVQRSLVETGLRLALSPLQSGLKDLAGGASAGSSESGGVMSGLVKGLGSLLGSVFGGGSAATGAAAAPFAAGGVFSRGAVMPFAQGGVVGAPSYFPLGRGLGVMGEKGAEAVMPLARGPDGRLGVRAGGGGGGRPMSVTVNVSTPDADSFRRSEAQVSAALARAVARGQRGL